jgi:hypothetical protein
MKKSHVSDHIENESAGKHFVCWNKDTQAQMLRVELADGSFSLFSYGHLGMVRLERHNESDLLQLSFAKHEIEITGKHLRELGLAFQKLAVNWVSESPARYAAMANSDSACITSIKVNALPAK